MFEQFQDAQYFELVKRRLRDTELTWVKQATEIIQGIPSITTVNDIGCNVGQLYKNLRKSPNIEYRGFDFEEKYLQFAREFFSVSADVFRFHDIEKSCPSTADVTVCSATLEHLKNPIRGLEHLLESTDDTIILRTFLGDNPEISMFQKQTAKLAYPIHQFSFSQVAQLFECYNFSVDFRKDIHTESIPRHLGNGIIRSFYFIIGKKNGI